MKAAHFTFTPHVIKPKSFTDNSFSTTRLLLFWAILTIISISTTEYCSGKVNCSDMQLL